MINFLNRIFLRAERWLGRRLFAAEYFSGERKFLFIIGHMRSGSSLLTHILSSHPDILGYGETQNVYVNPDDFGATTAKIARHFRSLPAPYPYIMDKVLHKGLIANTDIFLHPAVRIIFLIREPAESLTSMIRNRVVQNDRDAYDHFERQLEWIISLIADLNTENWTFTTYDELIDHTTDSFQRLQNLLRLSKPLSEKYKTTKFTGVRGIGDSGPNIEEGKIKRNITREIDFSILPYTDSARELYHRCLNLLQSRNIY